VSGIRWRPSWDVEPPSPQGALRLFAELAGDRASELAAAATKCFEQGNEKRGHAGMQRAKAVRALADRYADAAAELSRGRNGAKLEGHR
jgi:hypothetical protein